MELKEILKIVKSWKKIPNNSERIRSSGKYYNRKIDGKNAGIVRIRGIYAICFTSKKDIKIYIGQTKDIYGRLHIHTRDLKNGKHFSKRVQACYDNKQYKMHLSMVKAFVDDCEILEKEQEIFLSIPERYRLNRNVVHSLEVMKPFLDRGLKSETYKKYNKIQRNPDFDECWESLGRIDKDGYGIIKVQIKKIKKKIPAHRVAYYGKTGRYPHLIRHLCGNKVCRNPDHLCEGSIEKNLNECKTTYKEELGGSMVEKFEEAWLERKGDVGKLIEWFDEKLGSNASSIIPKRSRVYYWEKVTGVREKYPEIFGRGN